MNDFKRPPEGQNAVSSVIYGQNYDEEERAVILSYISWLEGKCDGLLSVIERQHKRDREKQNET